MRKNENFFILIKNGAVFKSSGKRKGENGKVKAESGKLKGENGKVKAESGKLKGENEKVKTEKQEVSKKSMISFCKQNETLYI